jgi:hypothetical protein
MADSFPIQTVAKCLGHDAKVALKHYAQTTDEHFDRAVGHPEVGTQAALQTPAKSRRFPQNRTQLMITPRVEEVICDLPATQHKTRKRRGRDSNP